MFCQNCGKEIPNDAAFCPECGTKVEAVVDNVEAPAETPVEAETENVAEVQVETITETPAEVENTPLETAKPEEPVVVLNQQNNTNTSGINPVQVLVFGIVALACAFVAFYCNWGGVPISVVGIVFGALALKKAKIYNESGAVYTAKVKVGKILGTIGLILGCVALVTVIIYSSCITCMACYSASSYSSYYPYIY